MATGRLEQYVLMPARGTRATDPNSTVARAFLQAHAGAGAMRMASPRGQAEETLRVIDSIHEDGIKLIEGTPAAVLALRAEQPGLRVVPLVLYRPALAPRPTVAVKPKAAAGTKLVVRVVSKTGGSPVAGALVVACTDFAARAGAQGTTSKNGEVGLALGGSSKKLERLYIYPERGFWSFLKHNVTVTNGTTLKLHPIDVTFVDGLRFFAGASTLHDGEGVTVGVVDTGIDTSHPDLHLSGGFNAVPGENPGNFGDNGLVGVAITRDGDRVYAQRSSLPDGPARQRSERSPRHRAGRGAAQLSRIRPERSAGVELRHRQGDRPRGDRWLPPHQHEPGRW